MVGDKVSRQNTQGLVEHGKTWGFILSVMGSHSRVLNRKVTGTVKQFSKNTFVPVWRTDWRGARRR